MPGPIGRIPLTRVRERAACRSVYRLPGGCRKQYSTGMPSVMRTARTPKRFARSVSPQKEVCPPAENRAVSYCTAEASTGVGSESNREGFRQAQELERQTGMWRRSRCAGLRCRAALPGVQRIGSYLLRDCGRLRAAHRLVPAARGDPAGLKHHTAAEECAST